MLLATIIDYMNTVMSNQSPYIAKSSFHIPEIGFRRVLSLASMYIELFCMHGKIHQGRCTCEFSIGMWNIYHDEIGSECFFAFSWWKLNVDLVWYIQDQDARTHAHIFYSPRQLRSFHYQCSNEQVSNFAGAAWFLTGESIIHHHAPCG
jgi:hypothetical protein